MAAKKKAAVEAPLPTQRERALEAIGRMHSFDSFWLEKLEEVLDEAHIQSQKDGSLVEPELVHARVLLQAAKGTNEARKKFPKPWVTT